MALKAQENKTQWVGNYEGIWVIKWYASKATIIIIIIIIKIIKILI